MDEETIQALLRSRAARMGAAGQQQLLQQQDLFRGNSLSSFQQLNHQTQGLGTSSAVSEASLLFRARSPVEAPSPGATGVDRLASPRMPDWFASLTQPSAFSSAMLSSSARAPAAERPTDLSSLVIDQEIKRLRQLQQLQQQSASASPFLPAPVEPNSALLQQYLLDKAQGPRFGQFSNAFGGSLGATNPGSMPPHRGSFGSGASSQSSILESQLLQEARMLMRRQSVQPSSTFAAAASAKAPAPFPQMPEAKPQSDGSRKMRGGVIEPFPEKLHRLLLEVELSGRTDVISFVSEGRAFAIHNSEVFFREIVPLYFRQSRLSSFKRQLNLYGFELINTGMSRGAYYHELFQRDRPEMCRRMRRVAVKVSAGKASATASSGGDADREKCSSDEEGSAASVADCKLSGV